jgi:hypothetical protein
VIFSSNFEHPRADLETLRPLCDPGYVHHYAPNEFVTGDAPVKACRKIVFTSETDLALVVDFTVNSRLYKLSCKIELAIYRIRFSG